jgi:predicted nucleic acid-binding protein
MYLLDTNVVSQLRRPEKAAANVRDWAARTPSAHFYLSVITVLEIEKGILLAERKDKAQALALRMWLEKDLLPGFDTRILAIDVAVARRCAGLHVPDPRPDRDALIAATALVHGMTMVTRNVGDFEGAGVPLLNPWKAAM